MSEVYYREEHFEGLPFESLFRDHEGDLVMLVRPQFKHHKADLLWIRSGQRCSTRYVERFGAKVPMYSRGKGDRLPLTLLWSPDGRQVLEPQREGQILRDVERLSRQVNRDQTPLSEREQWLISMALHVLCDGVQATEEAAEDGAALKALVDRMMTTPTSPLPKPCRWCGSMDLQHPVDYCPMHDTKESADARRCSTCGYLPPPGEKVVGTCVPDYHTIALVGSDEALSDHGEG